MAYGSLRDSGFDPRHDELFQHLVRITRPLPAVEAVSQTRHEVRTEQDAATAGLMSFRDGEMKPVPPQQIAGLKLGSFEGTTCTVRYRYRGQEREFSARPDGSWMDAQGVLRAFNAFMQEIGREERAFRLADAPGTDGEHAFFLCAKQQPFLAAAAELGIPLALPSEQLQSDLPAGSP
jgi:hypothetical protein